jgi:hypothetical protein
MTHIKVPKPPASAFNPDRPASSLLRAQILHLEHALGRPESPPNKRWTEGAAARYIAELTAELTGQPLPVPFNKPKKTKPPKRPTKKVSREGRKPRRR